MNEETANQPTDKIAAALARAQGMFPPIERTRTVRVKLKTGGTYTFDYAPLDSVIAAVAKALSENELSYRFIPHVEYKGDYAIVTQTCRLQHSSGQYFEASFPLLTNEMGPQQIGSTSTYGKRYAFESVIGVAAQLDDDGNAGSGNESEEYGGDEGGGMPACPKCGKTHTVIESKPEYGGGYFCFPKKGGCSTKFQKDQDHPGQDEPPPPAKKSKGKTPEPPAEDHGPPPETEESIAKAAAAAKATLDHEGIAALTGYLGMIANAKTFASLTELARGLQSPTVPTEEGEREKLPGDATRDLAIFTACRPALRAAGKYIQSEEAKRAAAEKGGDHA